MHKLPRITQSSVNLHAQLSQLQPFCSATLVPDVLPRRDEGSGKPFAVIEALKYIGCNWACKLTDGCCL